MENWGLVTYRTTALLFDEKTSDSAYKNRIAYVVAHGKTIHPQIFVGPFAYWPLQNLLTNGSEILLLWTGGLNCGSTRDSQRGLDGTPSTTSILVSILCIAKIERYLVY